MICIVLHRDAKTSVSGSNSCEVTRSTVQVVDDCPVNEEEWRKAAARKNCIAFASQCSEPDKLVYHCVINEYVNQTLELCAYLQNIVLGKCTSYAIRGNVIQENWRTDCTKFKENACPQFYRSDVAYKYPDCYQLTKILTTPSSNMSSIIHVKTQGKEEKMVINKTAIVIIMPIIFVVLAVLIVCVLRRNRKKIKRRTPFIGIPKTGENHQLNAGDNVDEQESREETSMMTHLKDM